MKKHLLVPAFSLFAAFSFSQVNGKIILSAGQYSVRPIEIINANGELVYGNKSAADEALTVKSFSVEFSRDMMHLTVSTTEGKSTLSKEDMKTLNGSKGEKAVVKNRS